MITRRTFLAASLLALPGAKVLGGLARALPLREAEFILRFGDFPPILITTFTNGTLKGNYGVQPLNVRPDGNWVRLSCFTASLNSCELRVRRDEPNSLLIDWVHLVGEKQIMFDDYTVNHHSPGLWSDIPSTVRWPSSNV